MADATVAVRFAADLGDLVAGIGEARDALSSLAPSFADLNGQSAALAAALGATFNPARLQPYDDALTTSAAIARSLAAAHAEAAEAIKTAQTDASEDALRAARIAVTGEVTAETDALRQKLALYAEEAREREITIAQKLALSRQALGDELAAKVAALQQEAALGDQSLAQKTRIDEQILSAEQHAQDQMIALTRKAIEEQAGQYQALASTVTQAFNSQLHGLLSGTESWRQAFKNVLEELLIKFIEWGEATVVHQAATEAAKTAATTAGVTARTGAEQTGAAASLATQAATMVRSILSSAAETFAGVFGFLAPIMGPFAAGPAVAAQATVASMAGAVAAADIGMWRVPEDMLTLVHHNELVMPAAEAGSFRNLLSSEAPSGAQGAVHIHPTTNFHVSAVDSGSVAQWMKANSATMMGAIDEAVRHGAHLGLRRLRS
ncbi:MAG: hypothetical protein ABSF67_03740 [Roseiarcus sp.]|jgi:hypothetical protein